MSRLYLLLMALYVVKAKPIKERLTNLRKEMDSGDISKLTPFGEELHQSLQGAKVDSMGGGYAYWVEEDYCSPPLAMERESVLDRYFENLTVKPVETREEGWRTIPAKSSLWEQT